MKKYSIVISICAALLFMCSLFQPGYRIIVNDKPLPGIFQPRLARQCSQAAIRAAEEITRQEEAPSYTMIPALCLKYTEADPNQLWGLLLESFEGVEKHYIVTLHGAYIGTVSNLRDVYLIKHEYFPTWSPDTTLTIRETYTYAGAETSHEEMHAAFRQLSTDTLPV